MAKAFLRPPFDALARDLIETLIAGHKRWRPDLDYPESHSDMQGAVRAVLQKYDVQLRAVPLDYADIVEPPSVCPVCKLPTGDSVKTLGRINDREVYAHPECVTFPSELTTLAATFGGELAIAATFGLLALLFSFISFRTFDERP